MDDEQKYVVQGERADLAEAIEAAREARRIVLTSQDTPVSDAAFILCYTVESLAFAVADLRKELAAIKAS